MKKKTHART